MKLEDIVCDFEYAEKLKELGLDRGFENDSLFGFFKTAGVESEWIILQDYTELPTYTVAELGEMLPENIFLKDKDGQPWFHPTLQFNKTYEDKYSYYYNLVGSDDFEFETLPLFRESVSEDDKEANSRAKLLIWLIENNHLNVEDLNK